MRVPVPYLDLRGMPQYGGIAEVGASSPLAQYIPPDLWAQIVNLLETKQFDAVVEVPDDVGLLGLAYTGWYDDQASRATAALVTITTNVVDEILRLVCQRIVDRLLTSLAHNLPAVVFSQWARSTSLGKLGAIAGRAVCKEIFGLTDDESAVCGTVGAVIGTIVQYLTSAVGVVVSFLIDLGVAFANWLASINPTEKYVPPHFSLKEVS
jgi:hypothetical protein